MAQLGTTLRSLSGLPSRRMGRHGMLAAAIACGAWGFLGRSGLAAEDLPVGAVVWPGGDATATARLQATANEVGGAHWTAHSLATAPSSPAPDFASERQALRDSYFAADFLACLSKLHDPMLRYDRLLAAGQTEVAIETSVFGAACALGNDDEELATQLLTPLLVAEHDLGGTLAATTPDFQALADRLQTRLMSRGRHTVVVTGDPENASVRMDGYRECNVTPCRFDVLPGDHHITVQALGRVDRSVRETVSGDREVRVRLDAAPATEAKLQLGNALGSGVAADGLPFLQTVSHAYGARVALVISEGEEGPLASLYDRGLDRVVARASVAEDETPSTAMRSVIQEWQGVVEPTALTEEPWFWVAVGAAVAATAAVVFVAVNPEDKQHDLVFRAN